MKQPGVLTDLALRSNGRPLLAGRFIAHRLAKRIDQRLLRRTYSRRIAAPIGGELRLPPLDITPFSRLPAGLRQSAERIEHAADRALAHEVDLLGSGWTAL